MLRQKKGKAINISSISADWTLLTFLNIVLGGSEYFTRCLVSEWAPFNICVVYCSGDTNTDMLADIMADAKLSKIVLDAILTGRLAGPRGLDCRRVRDLR